VIDPLNTSKWMKLAVLACVGKARNAGVPHGHRLYICSWVITHRFMGITKIYQEARGGSLRVDNITGDRIPF